MAKRKKIEEASADDAKALLSVTENEADEVLVRGRRFKVRWLHPATGDWITVLMNKGGNDSKVLAQASALVVLNGFWRSHLWYWLLWRWFYYVKHYTSKELTPILEMAQKKTAQEEAPAYFNAMTLLTVLSTTRKQMTKEEANNILQGLRMGRGGSSRKSTE